MSSCYIVHVQKEKTYMYKMYPKYMYMYMYVELKYMLPCSLFCRCFQVDSLNGGSLLPLNGGR